MWIFMSFLEVLNHSLGILKMSHFSNEFFNFCKFVAIKCSLQFPLRNKKKNKKIISYIEIGCPSY